MLVLALVLCVAILDQLAKWAVLSFAPLHNTIVVVPRILNLTHIHNTGAAWGMLQGQNTWLVVFSLAVMAFLFSLLRVPNNRCLVPIAVAFMAGGILGNLMDRIRLGYVVDYIDVYAGQIHFPAFNVADSAICIGVAIYAVQSLLGNRPRETCSPPAETHKPESLQ